VSNFRTFALAITLAATPAASLLAADPASEPATDHKSIDSGSGDTTMRSAAPGYQSKSAIEGPATNATEGESGKIPGETPGAAADASKTGVTRSSEAHSTTTSTATGRPPGVPEGTTAGQLPTNTSEAKSQPPTTALKPRGP
jgi:hypothetical protein